MLPRARYLVVAPTLDTPLGSVNEISFSTLASTQVVPTTTKTVTPVYPTVTTSPAGSGTRGSSTTSSSSSINRRGSTISSNSRVGRITTTSDNPIEQPFNLDKILKAKLVSDDMSISDSVDENLLEFYNAPMHFGTENSSAITVQAGAVAHLPCTVHQLGEGVVSSFFDLFFSHNFAETIRPFTSDICVAPYLIPKFEGKNTSNSDKSCKKSSK